MVGSSVELFGPAYAVFWEHGVIHTLPDFGGPAVAFSVNDAGTIVGAAANLAGRYRPVVWRDSVLSQLPLLYSAGQGYATAINERGWIAGAAEDDQQVHQPVVWRDLQLIQLGSLDPIARWGQAHALNDRGIVGGISRVSDAGGEVSQRATLWRDGHPLDLGFLNWPISTAHDINEHDDVVGQSDGIGGWGRAFLWRQGVMHDLNDSIAAGSGWTLVSARGINDAGQITGDDYCPCGVRHGFVLTPVP